MINSPPAAASRNPFSVAGYRIWWVASIVAGTGVGVQTVTVPLFIRDRVSDDSRASAIALALICQTIPGALLALVGGVIADRVERRRILVRTYAVAGAISLVYVALAGADVDAIWPVFILSAIVGGAGAFTNPARQSMMPQILQQSQLQNGAIFGTMAFMATVQFGGPALGGLVADGWGLTAGFAFEVAALTLAALLFWTVAADAPAPSGRSVLHDLKEGLAYVRNQPALMGILALGTVPGMLLMGPFTVTNVLMVEDVYKESDKYVGFLFGAMGAGILVGSIVMTIVKVHHRGLLLCGSLFGGGIFWVLYPIVPNVWLALACIFVAGILGPAIFINFAVALLQENSDRAMMGRVMSIYGLSFMASTPIGYALAAGQVALWGPRLTLGVSAGVAVVLGLLAMAFLRPVTRLP